MLLSRGVFFGLAFAVISPTNGFASPSQEPQKLIQQRNNALQICQDGHKAENYRAGYRESNSDCNLSNELSRKLEQQGWCEREKFKQEVEHKFVGCNTFNLVSGHFNIDKEKDRPETSSLEAKWLLSLETTSGLSDDDVPLGFISITCNGIDGARTLLSVADNTSGVSGLPSKSELDIGGDVRYSSAYVLPTNSDKKTIVFDGADTLRILRWIHTSVDGSDFLTLKTREYETERQILVLLSNITTSYSESTTHAKRWAAHMHTMCESFSQRAEPM